MSANDLGNSLNRIVNDAQKALLNQSELAQLTYGAFDIAFHKVQSDPQEKIAVTYPVGLAADNQPMAHTKEYGKQELLAKYRFLGLKQLGINAILHLVTHIEAMTSDVLRTVIAKYPLKLGSDKKISLGTVLASASIESIHAHAIDSLLNDLSYKSPKDFAEVVDNLIGIRLLECSAYHRYVELKATRDVYIHNRGFANETYIRKAEHHARVRAGDLLPVDLQYFLQSFEQCMQLTEWLEKELHEKWHSSEFESRHTLDAPVDTAVQRPDDVSELLRELAVKYAKSVSERNSDDNVAG